MKPEKDTFGKVIICACVLVAVFLFGRFVESYAVRDEAMRNKVKLVECDVNDELLKDMLMQDIRDEVWITVETEDGRTLEYFRRETP
jgi:hypothetical protein